MIVYVHVRVCACVCAPKNSARQKLMGQKPQEESDYYLHI